MHIIIAKTVYMDGTRRTAVARHVAPGTVWQDTLSGNGSTVLTIIEGDLTEAEIMAINTDQDVIDHLELQIPPDSELPSHEIARAARLAVRHGFPIDALPARPTAEDLRAAVVKRMRYSQVIAGVDLNGAARVESTLRERLAGAAFDIDDLTAADDEESIRQKVLRSRSRSRR